MVLIRGYTRRRRHELGTATELLTSLRDLRAGEQDEVLIRVLVYVAGCAE